MGRVPVICILLVLVFGAGYFVTTHAGEVSKPNYSRYFEWESTECYKPRTPYIQQLDDYNKREVERYTEDVLDYIRCVEREARNDYDEAQRLLLNGIEAGRDKTISDVRDEAERFLSRL